MLLELFEKADSFAVTTAEFSINLFHLLSVLLQELQNTHMHTHTNMHACTHSDEYYPRDVRYYPKWNHCLPAGAARLLSVEWGSSRVQAAGPSGAAAPSWRQKRRDGGLATGPDRGRSSPLCPNPAAPHPSSPVGTPRPWCVRSVDGGALSASVLQNHVDIEWHETKPYFICISHAHHR